ncbi:hypothetical protein TWF718_006542 [Orbilia javanica]|uniref:Secreted protein n=1 Tax=Orbilia javanica TaxID=47235 RepID=A0AAN8MST4_9PEZI
MKVLSTAVVLAVLSYVSPISAHCVFIGAIGDRPGAANGQALGISSTTHVKWGKKNVGFRSNDRQWPFQKDTTVFSSPAVPWRKPNCWDKKCCKKYHKKKNPFPCFPKGFYTPVPRRALSSGCGVTLEGIANDAARRNDQTKWKSTPGGQWNVRFFQRPVTSSALTNVQSEINRCIGMGKLTTASAGGYLKIHVHQLNADGGGPFRCRLDTSATAGADSKWQWVTVQKNIPGNKFGVNKYKLKKWWMVVKLPTNLDCQGAANGRKNICLMRCENNARNGPFGGCIPFEQWKPQVDEPEPEQPPPEPEVEEETPAKEEEIPDDNVEPVEDDEGSEYEDGY